MLGERTDVMTNKICSGNMFLYKRLFRNGFDDDQQYGRSWSKQDKFQKRISASCIWQKGTEIRQVCLELTADINERLGLK